MKNDSLLKVLDFTKLDRCVGIIILSAFFLFQSLSAQTTAFNFQGRLNDGSAPANGHYDLQFKLFNLFAGGIQIGPTVDRVDLVVVNGTFSTALDFGSAAFSGGDRFIEISLRPNGSPNAYVVLGARQQIQSVPFAVRSMGATQAENATNAQNATNAAALGGLSASNYARLNFQNSGDLQTSGAAAFGSAAPNTKLTLSGGPTWTSNGWTASMNMQNGAAMGWEPNASGQRFGIGQSNNGLYFFRTYADFGQTNPPAQIDLTINDNGSLVQPAEVGGLVKAMVAVTAGGVIARCYNGTTGSSSCAGFSIVLGSTDGEYNVVLPVSFVNRFWLVNPDTSFVQNGNTDTNTASTGISNLPNSLRVFMRKNGTPTNLPFHLFVF